MLFATDLSPECSRATAALGQLGRACEIDADIVHVVSPRLVSPDIVERLFRAAADVEAAHVRLRVVVDENAATAITRLCEQDAYDLVMVPSASSRWRLTWKDSVRAAILQQGRVPLWTVGSRLDPSRFDRPIRRVGCYVSLEPGGDAHLAESAALAARLGASLHVVHVVPPIDDGTIADAFESQRPLTLDVARARLADMMAHGPDATTSVVLGTTRREVRRWLQAHDIDLLCIGPDEAMRGHRITPLLRRLPCPVVCLGGTVAGATRAARQGWRARWFAPAPTAHDALPVH